MQDAWACKTTLRARLCGFKTEFLKRERNAIVWVEISASAVFAVFHVELFSDVYVESLCLDVLL
jgi:hypothetical protein